MASTDAIPIPRKNVAYRVTFPILDADGDLVTGASALDSEVSKDAGTFTDCTNEATEIATNSGMYYLDVTSTEMNADCVAIIVKTSTSGAKTVPIVLYPQETGDIKVDVQSLLGTVWVTPGTAGTPDVNVLLNADKTGYALTSGERTSVADALLNRDLSTGSDSGSSTVRTVRQALRFLRNKWAIAAGTLTVYKEDDSTSSWTSVISTDAAAIPIIGTDPAGP